MDIPSRLKKPSKRSQLPHPKSFAAKAPKLNPTPDVVQVVSSPSSHVVSAGINAGAIGSRVCVGREKSGTLRFFGLTKFARGVWCGVELDEAVGKNDGKVDGYKYFECRMGHGIFAPPEKVSLEADANCTFNLGNEDNHNNITMTKTSSASRGDVKNQTIVVNNDADAREMSDSFDPNSLRTSFNEFSFEPSFESTPIHSNSTSNNHNNCFQSFPASSKLKGNCTFVAANNDFMSEQDFEENCDPNSNNDDLSDLGGNTQSGFAHQISMDPDESLGILTPDQMKDFTLPLDSSCCGGCVQTPSDEGIQEITEEEVVELMEDTSDTTPVENGYMSDAKWEESGNIDGYQAWTNNVGGQAEKSSSDENGTAEFESEESDLAMDKSQSDVLNTTFVQPKSRTAELMMEHQEQLVGEDKRSVNADEFMMQDDLFDLVSRNILTKTDRLSTTNIQHFENEVSLSPDPWTEMRDFVKHNFPEPTNSVEVMSCHLDFVSVEAVTQQNLLRVSAAAKKECEKPAEMAVSATSIDTGYQGDVECDLASDGGTNPAGTPVEEKLLTDSLVISLEQRLIGRGDPGSDSDFCSDMGASWTESEMDTDDKGQRVGGGGCRSARIIDGKLYYNVACSSHETRTSFKEVASAKQVENYEVKEKEMIVETKALDPLEMDSAGSSIGPNSSENESSSRLEEPNIISRSPSPLPPPPHESSNETLDVTMTENNAVSAAVDEHSVSQTLNTTSSSSASKSPTENPRKSKTRTTLTKRASATVVEVNKSKSPRKNVMSKIKAMIEATSNKLNNGKDGAAKEGNSQTPEARRAGGGGNSKNKWTPVMSKIEANRKEESKKPKSRREIVSRVDSNLIPVRVNGQIANRSPKPEARPPLQPNRPINKKMPTQSTRAAPSLKSTPKQLTTQKNRENIARNTSITEASTSEQPISQISHSRKSKLPISGHSASLRIHNATGNSRSPSELSIASCDSQGTTMSQITFASHSSSKPVAHDASNESLGSNRINANGSAANASRKVATTTIPAAKHIATAGGDVKNVVNKCSKRLVSERVSLLQRKSIVRTDRKSTVTSGPSSSQLTSDGGSQLKSNQTLNNGLVKSGQHPDLLPASVGKSFYNQEVSRLEALCETRTKKLNVVSNQLKHCALGFDSMVVLVNYLTNEMNGLAMPSVLDELGVLQEKYRLANQQLQEYVVANANLSKEIGMLQDKFMVEQEQTKSRFRSELEMRQTEITSVHQKTIENMKSQHCHELEQMQLDMKFQVEKMKADVDEKETEIRKRDDFLDNLKSEHLKELNDIRGAFEKKSKEYESSLIELEDLKVISAELEKQKDDLQVLLNSDADVKVQVITSHRNNLKKEVESLRAVLDMKMNDIKKLQQEKIKLSDIAEELDKANENIKKLHAKNEDLKEMVQSRTESERSVTSNHEVLLRQFASKAEDNKRLSLENEALQWKLRNSMNGSISDCEGNGNPTNYYYIWDDEGMQTSCRGGLMSSSWNGHSSFKNVSPGSPRDRFTWSPSHNCFSSTNSRLKHSQRCFLKGGDEEVFSSPFSLKLNSPKTKKRKAIHSSTPNCASVDCRAVVAVDNIPGVETYNNQSDAQDEILENSLSPLFADLGEFQTLMKEGNEEMQEGSDAEHRTNVEQENEQFIIEDLDSDDRAENETKIVIDTENQVDNRCDIFEQILDVEVMRSDSRDERDFLLDEDLHNTMELEQLVSRSEKEQFEDSGDDFSVINLERSSSVQNTSSCSSNNPRFSQVDVHFDLIDSEMFSSFQDELVIEPLLMSSTGSDSNVTADTNDASSSSEEMLGSLEDSSSLITVTETSSRESANEDLVAISSNYNNESMLPCISDSITPIIPKTTTTVVITFRPNLPRTSNCGSHEVSTVQAVMESSVTSEDASEAPITDDPSSSSRASPLEMDESFPLDKNTLQSLNQNMYRVSTQSPRTSAGEALMAETENSQMNIYEAHRHQLLKKALQDQLPQSGSSCSSIRELSSEDCSPLLGMSKPDTPDIFVNQLIVNKPMVNGAANTDDSWSYSDDDLPSETEI